jgi:toxin ParE1/3/4
MEFVFHNDAEDEFYASIKYYNNERPGLGFEFANEINNTMHRISLYPDTWSFVSKNVRKCPVNCFPYALLYSQHDNKIIIIAVMHLRREPGYWENRQNND